MTISDTTVYLCDNGAAYCGRHLGMTARYSGHDISGQPIQPVTPDVVREAQRYGYDVPVCETCGQKAG